MADYGIYIAAGGLFFTLVGYAIKLTWRVRDVEAELRADMDAQIDNIQRDVSKLQTDGGSKLEILRHDTGEMGSALRAKIHEIETWNRDTFVRKDSFEMVIGRLEKSIEKLGDKIEDKMERIVERIQKRPE